jgi:hypothetical protein
MPSGCVIGREVLNLTTLPAVEFFTSMRKSLLPSYVLAIPQLICTQSVRYAG